MTFCDKKDSLDMVNSWFDVDKNSNVDQSQTVYEVTWPVSLSAHVCHNQ